MDEGVRVARGLAPGRQRHAQWHLDTQGDGRVPEEWPLPVKVFAIWLVIVLWKRASDGATAAAGS
jgi:hypothetical protein